MNARNVHAFAQIGEGALDVQTQGTVGVTPFVRLGNLAILLICISILGFSFLANRASAQRPGPGL